MSLPLLDSHCSLIRVHVRFFLCIRRRVRDGRRAILCALVIVVGWYSSHDLIRAVFSPCALVLGRISLKVTSKLQLLRVSLRRVLSSNICIERKRGRK